METDSKKHITFAEIALALAADYESIYVIDADDDSYIEYLAQGADNELIVRSSGESFYTDTIKNCRVLVYPDDQDYFLESFKKENVIEILTSGKSFSLNYRLMVDGKPLFYYLKTIRGVGNKVIIGVRNVDEQKRKELAADLEETLAKRDALMDRVAGEQDELQRLEVEHGEDSRRLTERRITAAQMENELQLTAQQNADAERRREELQKMIAGREAGIRGYEDSIQRLRDETAELMASLDDLKQAAVDIHGQVEEARMERGELQTRLSQSEGGLGAKRASLDEARSYKGRLEVAATEATMRRQNVYDHLSQEYGLDANAVLREPDPDWKGGEPPPNDVLEERVNALNAQIAALGPVNMVAIEEFRELEERYTKEKAQEADLLAAKEQIRALIANLNEKSGDMFRTTFEQANQNFQKMFTKLFNGGEARLVLLENAEDPLECGIDIIARPPGKRPQSVTLLSGGERTMTAVALLFAIFMIKPAPFCMLDELDAALDDANIGRFVEALKEFLDRSQFLIITHNQHTIAGSDLVYGVSQQEKGISRIISMRLADIGVKPVPEDETK